jgi:uncharacterized membrane protein YraQ (UPF0718 family)
VARDEAASERRDVTPGWRDNLRAPSVLIFAALAVASGGLCFIIGGEDAFRTALSEDLDLLVQLLPRMAAAVLLAGLVQALVPRQWISRWVGEDSGLRGIVVASLAGMLTPGGPMTSFSLVIALQQSGADRGALVAYVTSWSLLGVQRMLVWEIPLLGSDFALLRFAVSAALPIVAGLLARRLPIDIDRGFPRET